MGGCASRPRRRKSLPRKIKIRSRRRSSAGSHSVLRVRTSASSSGQPRRSLEAVSPRSIVSDDSVYYSDSDRQEGSPHHPGHTYHHAHHDSDLLEATVEDFEGDEQTLVDKLMAWWDGFSLLGGTEGDDTIVVDDEGMLERINEHREQQRRLQPHRVTIVEEDDDSMSASLSCASFSKKKRPMKLSKVALGDPDVAESKRHTRSWASPDPTSFYVRSKDYMKDKVKLPAACSLYRVIKVETVTFERREDHIAELLDVPRPSDESVEAGKAVRLPPILIIQLQMPMYPSVLFGEHDGESCSLIYYSELDPDVATMPRYAVDMATRFVEGGSEEDGGATRDRFKLIPRIVNVEEWGREAGLSSTELRLVTNYNGKPLLMRPQFSFFRDVSYFEIDVDIHNYAYIARRAFCGYVPRLGPSVFDNGFVLQGNNERELPEVLLTAIRVFRTDFRRSPRMMIT